VRPPSAREAAKLPGLVYDTTFRGEGALSLPERPSTSYSSVREVVQVIDDRILTFDPAEPDQAKAFVERGFLPPGSKRYKDRRFMFDRVFRPESSQQEVYDATSRPLLQRLLDGFNTTVFAYGVSLVFWCYSNTAGPLNFVALLRRQQVVARHILSVEQIPTQELSI
jgi:kinesin family member 18/19